MIDLVIAPAQPSCQDGMRGQSILAVVDLRSAHNDQFLQLGGNSSSLHDGAEMRNHRAHDLWAMSHGAKHVRHIAAHLLVMVKDLSGLFVNGIAIEAGNTHESQFRNV
jgi:hypothetical protein